MNKKIILGSAIAAIALSPLTASAVSGDEQYPAANFQPKVIYQDKEAIKEEPTEKPAAKPERKKAEFDPKYPAANFEPKVIFPAPAAE